MAVDTAARRFSALNPAVPWGAGILPDAVIAASDRRALAKMYSGLAAGNAYSIEASAGSFVMTGSNAELTPTTHIDTSQERFAAINPGCPWRGPSLFPTGSIGRPQRQVIANYYVPYSTGATYTLQAEAGTFVWDGEPSFSDFEISTTSGSFAMTGNAIDLIATRKLVATAGVFTMTGSDSDLRILTEKTLIPETGIYVMTGNGVTFSRPRTLVADTAAFEMAGPTADLQWFNAAGELVPLPVIRSTRAVSVGKRRNYTYKGKRYYQLTNDELAKLIAQDLIDISREDIQVSYKNQKSHKVSKDVFAEILDTASKLPKQEISDDQDIEDIIALL